MTSTHERTPLIPSSTSTTTTTGTIENGGDVTTNALSSSTKECKNCHCNTKNNNDATSARNIFLGFGFSIFCSCVLYGTYMLGLIAWQSHTSIGSIGTSSTETLQQQHNTDDYTMKVSSTKGYPLSDDLSSLSSQYVATQFISFTINTMGGVAEHGECTGRVVDPNNGSCYLGDLHNITNDVQQRLRIVEYMLHRIKQDAFMENPDIDHMDNVLKIVSLPEFFWRGPYGAYTVDELYSVFGLFATELRRVIKDDIYSDFLFCYGTIIAARSSKDTLRRSGKRRNHLHATEVEYFNFAPISTGGPNHHSYIITKQYISNADFLSRSVSLPNPTEENVRDYADFDDALQHFFTEQNITLVMDNVIVIDDIRIGIEICLDHRLGVLWNNLLSKHHGNDLVDVLLITSAGMAIERGPNPVVPGGVVYLCDGSASSAVCIRPNEVNVPFHPNQICRGDTSIIGLKHIPIGTPGYSSFVELSGCWDIDDDSLLKGYYSQYQPQGCAFTLSTYDINVLDDMKFYPPSIEIYPTIALPRSYR